MGFQKVMNVALTPVVTAGAYSNGDVVGGLLTFAVSSVSGNGTIARLLLVDDSNQKAALDLYLFSDAPTSIADNAAFAPLVADLKLLVTIIPIAAADYTTVNSNAYALFDNLDLGYVANGGNNLYGYLVVSTATVPTYAAITDIYVALTVTGGG